MTDESSDNNYKVGLDLQFESNRNFNKFTGTKNSISTLLISKNNSNIETKINSATKKIKNKEPDTTVEVMDKLKQYLLEHVDDKNLKNNIDYIQKWQQYYHTAQNDIKIIFLMKYKKISVDYYWMYIELGRFFSAKNKKGISVFILKYAIKRGVFGTLKVEHELQKYVGIESAQNSEANKYLNPTKFVVLGKIWNDFELQTYYDPKIISNNMSFEEYRLMLHEENGNELGSVLYNPYKCKRYKTDIVLYNKEKIGLKQNQHAYNNKPVLQVFCNLSTECKTVSSLSLSCLYSKTYQMYNLLQNSVFLYSTQKIKQKRHEHHLINLSDVLYFAPDIIKLMYIKKTFFLVLSQKLCIDTLEDFYIDKRFNIASRNIFNKHFNEEKAISTLVFVFSKYIDPMFAKNFDVNIFCKNVLDSIRCKNIQTIETKFQIYVLENLLLHKAANRINL